MPISFIDPTQLPFVATFLLVFAIVFGLLSLPKKTKNKRGEEIEIPMFDKKVNALIAVVFAFFAVLYEPLVVGLQEIMPFAAVGLIIIFFIVFLKKIFGAKEGKQPADLLPIAVSLALLLLVLTTVGGGDVVGTLFQRLGVSQSDAVFAVGLIVIILIFAAVYYHRGWPTPK